MHLKPFLCCTSLLVLLALPAVAEPLAPRGEVSVKGGTDRSLLTTEFWAPLAQQSDRVLYGDIRLMGDNDENREGNLGLGYRQIKNDAVFGVHGWIDRRRTQHNSTFHQLTFGVERLGHIVDARANVYIPINNGRTITTRNIGVTSPYLAGSGIYYDTNGSISETPQYGVDGELGYRIPVFQKQIDAIRLYGGGYYFFRDNTVEVPGARFRTEAQINKIVTVGARVQYDSPRGTQGFLEATLKFPFSAKRLYQESGIRSRLDESPERDVDIVTDSKVTDTGLRKPVIDAVTGTQQRILYVDNTKADGGDGSYEKPFNNLKAAEAALQANDILYINRGDGTTRNMNQGIVIDKPNVQLIGSATPLTYGGVTFLNAGAAPVITNNEVVTSDITGSGVYVTGNNITISGINVSNSNRNGVYIIAADGRQFENIVISNVGVFNNAVDGVKVAAANKAYVGNAKLTDITANGNRIGIYLVSLDSAVIDNATVSNGFSTSNRTNGFQLLLQNNGKAEHIALNNVNASNNTQNGVNINVDSGTVLNEFKMASVTAGNNGINGINTSVTASSVLNNIAVSNISANGNINAGLSFLSTTSGNIGKISIENVVSNNNGTREGIRIQADTGSQVSQTSFRNVTTNGNKTQGVYLYANGGTIASTTGSSITANANQQNGIYVVAQSSGTVSNLSLQQSITNSNTLTGTYFSTNTGVINNAVLSNITSSFNSQQGLYLNNASSSTISGVVISDTVANNNAQNGLFITNANATNSSVTNINVAKNSFLNNAVNGVFLQKSNAVSTFDVDLGGGAFASVGQNRSSGNTGKDLRLNYTGGGAVFAKNNWWGNAAGLQAGRVTLSASTTVDSTAFLTADPRP